MEFRKNMTVLFQGDSITDCGRRQQGAEGLGYGYVGIVVQELGRRFADLDPKITVVKKLAQEFDAIYVPFDQVFARALERAPANSWSGDGVHPTEEGHRLMAETWLRCVVGE